MKRITVNRIKFLILSLMVCLAFSPSDYAQSNKTDLQTHGLKGRVKTVEEYNVFFSPQEQIIKKNLRSLDTFDSKGRLTQSIQIIDQGDNSFYHRYKFVFDRKGRKKLEETYVSSKGRLQDIFLPDIAETNIKKLNPRLTEKLLLKIEYKFNAKGNISEDTVIDTAADETLKSVHIYRKNGDVNIYTSKNNGPFVLVLSSLYKDNKTRLENTNYQDSIPVYKTISYYENGKFLYREQFNLQPSPNNDRIIQTLAFRTKETTKGIRRETESLSFDKVGLPVIRSVHLVQNDLQTSQIVYKFQNDEWLVFYRTKTEYEFDKFGSWKKSIVYKQEGANPNFLKNFSVERKIYYY